MTKSNKISEYFAWLLKQYKSIQENKYSNAYRIVKINEKKNGSCKLTIQVTGRNVVFQASPKELATDDKMIECFSKQDVRTITYFACQEIKKPKYKILVKDFCSAFNKMIFSLKKHNDNSIIQKTAEQISQDKKLIEDLNPTDAHFIGYTSAFEKTHADKNTIQNIHNKKISKYKIVKQEYNNLFNTTIYTLENISTKKHIQKSANEIIKEHKFIRYLCSQDIGTIYYNTAIEKYRNDKLNHKLIHKYRITKQEYSDTYNSTIYSLEDKQNKDIIQKSTFEIYSNKNILQGLELHDAIKVSYNYAIEKLHNDQK